MPLYEFSCRGCGQLVELLLRGQEAPECPKCGGRDLQKQLSVVAAHRSGSGDALPVCEVPQNTTCGLPQCQSKCQFDL